MLSRRSIAHALPDLPRWVEVRAILLEEEGEILTFQQAPDLSLILHESATETVFVIGTPAANDLRAATQPIGPSANLITPHEWADWIKPALPDWTYTRIRVHTLPDLTKLPAISTDVHFLDPRQIPLLSLGDELRGELESGAEHSSIAASFVDQQPISFCYADSQTETLWDVSIDTVPEYQRRGYAAACAAYMIRYMHAQGKRPVWQAVEENPASWRLAQKLGFVPVDELALFELPDVGTIK